MLHIKCSLYQKFYCLLSSAYAHSGIYPYNYHHTTRSWRPNVVSWCKVWINFSISGSNLGVLKSVFSQILCTTCLNVSSTLKAQWCVPCGAKYCMNTLKLDRSAASEKVIDGPDHYCDVFADTPVTVYLTLLTCLMHKTYSPEKSAVISHSPP